MAKQRFCFVQDESSHWYMIPVKLRAKFIELDNDGSDEAADELNDKFEKYLTGGGIGHITFADPQDSKGESK